MAASDCVALSIVAPLYNEAETVTELVRRCATAAAAVTARFELIPVDDASTDATGALLRALAADARYRSTLRPVHLAVNGGQYAATVAGLRAARGDCVVVLDGDLQDPPELLCTLTDALARHKRATVAFAVKVAREDAAWMRLACAGLQALQRWLAPVATVRGAGSYCAMQRQVVQRVVRHPVRNANLAAVLAALGEPHTVVPYAKQPRAHGDSRVGAFGLFCEAWGSLAVTGALRRLAWLGGALALAATTAAMAAASIW